MVANIMSTLADIIASTRKSIAHEVQQVCGRDSCHARISQTGCNVLTLPYPASDDDGMTKSGSQEF
jgi:hypothetical protein